MYLYKRMFPCKYVQCVCVSVCAHTAESIGSLWGMSQTEWAGSHISTVTNRIKPDCAGRQIKKKGGGGARNQVLFFLYWWERSEKEKNEERSYCVGHGEEWGKIRGGWLVCLRWWGKQHKGLPFTFAQSLCIEAVQYFVCTHGCCFLHGRVMLLPLAVQDIYPRNPSLEQFRNTFTL